MELFLSLMITVVGLIATVAGFAIYERWQDFNNRIKQREQRIKRFYNNL